MALTQIAIVGAAGETGSSIVNVLLEDKKFALTALVRPSSISKAGNVALRERGVKILPVDLLGAQDKLIEALTGIDIVVSAVGPANLHDQIPLATAAKAVGVKRFVPCGFITVAPPRGIMKLRDDKEDVLDHIRRLVLPYTYIDVGWWYQISFPRIPSGKIDDKCLIPVDEIYGDGNTPSALTDLVDIGRYVAKVIVDDRTLNRMVLVYNQVVSPHETYELLEKLSGEKIKRNYVSEEQLNERLQQVRDALAQNPNDARNGMMLYHINYALSWGIRGDNTPEMAKYLGYITSKELYPDMEFSGYEEFLKRLLRGETRGVYNTEKKAIFDDADAK